MSLSKYIWMFVITLAFLGCEESEKVIESYSEDVIVPLNVGNSWTYRIIRPEEDTFGLKILTDTIVDRHEIQIGGAIYEVYGYRYTPLGLVINATDFQHLYRNEQDGYWYIGDYAWSTSRNEESIYVNRELLVKYPSQVGDIWFHDRYYYTKRIECFSLDYEIVTPIGTFNTIQYAETEEGALQRYNYYSPGVGLIAAEYFGGDSTYNWKLLLESYILK